jgi:hypothetical protein
MRGSPLSATRSRAYTLAVAFAVSVGLGLGTTACVTSTEPDAGAGTTVTTTASASSAPGVTGGPGQSGDTSVPPSEAMPVNLVGGGILDLAAYTDKPLLLWFWAPF